MTPSLKFTVTDAGRAAIVTPPTGLTAPFAFMAVGGGTVAGAGYTPTGQETALKSEFMRVPLGAGQKLAPPQIMFAATLDGDNIGWIREIGLFLQDGTLWAIWSEDPTVVQRVDDGGQPVYGAPLGYKTRGIPYTISALVTVQALALDALPIVVGAAPIALNVNLVERHLSNLLALVVDRTRALRDLQEARRADAAFMQQIARRLARLENA